MSSLGLMLRSIAAQPSTFTNCTPLMALRCVSKHEAAPIRAAPILRDART